MAPAGVLALSAADRQALIPMAAGYLILMSALGLGLYRLYRPRAAPPAKVPPAKPPPAKPPPAEVPPLAHGPATRPGPGQRTGRAAVARQIAGTVIGGYLLLMAVIVAYYYGVARVGPGFLEDALTGTALLLGLATPVFAALSWLAERRGRT
jgi:Family of unknown function (DUF6256)